MSMNIVFNQWKYVLHHFRFLFQLQSQQPNFKSNILVKFGQFSWDMATYTAWPRACDMAKVVKSGSPLPDVPVYTLGGESCRLVDILSTDKPTVINFGSLT